MTSKQLLAAAAALWLTLLAWTSPASARLRFRYPDDEVVARSELIIVGGLRDGSIRCVTHVDAARESRSFEYHATLRIARVLKGTTKATELPVVFHHGLVPAVGGVEQRDGFTLNLRGFTGKPVPPDAVLIGDTANFAGPLPVDDARQDNLWFLRPRGAIRGGAAADNGYAVVDPEDVQPLALEEYFAAYLSPDAEQAVRAQLAKHPRVRARAMGYLQRREIGRIGDDPNPARRAERLIPHYLSPPGDTSAPVARKALVACGPAAGPCLLALFDRFEARPRRTDIIRMLCELKYAGAVEPLIALLETHDRHFALCTKAPGWKSADASTGDNRQRYGEIYYGAAALRALGDSRARDVLERTLARWREIGFSDPQIVEECTAALRELPQAPTESNGQGK